MAIRAVGTTAGGGAFDAVARQIGSRRCQPSRGSPIHRPLWPQAQEPHPHCSESDPSPAKVSGLDSGPEPYVSIGRVLRTLTPGAPRSTDVAPKLEKEARSSLWSVAVRRLRIPAPLLVGRCEHPVKCVACIMTRRLDSFDSTRRASLLETEAGGASRAWCRSLTANVRLIEPVTLMTGSTYLALSGVCAAALVHEPQ